MAVRAVRELNATGDEQDADTLLGDTNTTTIASVLDINNMTASPSTTEADGLDVLQLMPKGQALAHAVVVVEGVLHKMEEQVTKRCVIV